jgi:DNA-binding NtrC family response regulator
MSFPTIISFTSEERCRAFQEALAGDGHPADIKKGRGWLDDPRTLPGPLLLLLPDHQRQLSNPSRVLHKAGGVASCYVVDGEAAAGTVLRRHTDPPVMIWPREHAAILGWLARAREEGRQGTSPETPLSLLEQFADLNLIGRSPPFVATLKLVKRTARTLAPVLIQGATGTGKELVARAIHYLGPRQSRPFIPLNCGTIPDSLLESELFGYVKGAFTDAKETRAGVIDLAAGGTLFLDEVNSLSRKAQIMFLRFLQDQHYRALGSTAIKQADVRIIAATNTRLSDMVASGEFRQDLLFRLAIVILSLPPLAERRDDIALLAQHFLKKLSAVYREPNKTLSPSTLAAMQRYGWPGNVRELENFIHRACILTESPVIDAVSLALHDSEPGGTVGPPAGSACRPMATLRQAKAEAVAECERQYLVAVMAQAGGNVTHAARLSGTERRALGKLLKKHGLRSRAPH